MDKQKYDHAKKLWDSLFMKRHDAFMQKTLVRNLQWKLWDNSEDGLEDYVAETLGAEYERLDKAYKVYRRAEERAMNLCRHFLGW